MNKFQKQKKHLTYCIKLLRNYRGYSQDYMAAKLGYKDRSNYARLERGETETIDMFMLLEICNLLDCNIVHISLLAGLDIFKTRIISLTDFIDSLEGLDEETRKHFLLQVALANIE